MSRVAHPADGRILETRHDGPGLAALVMYGERERLPCERTERHPLFELLLQIVVERHRADVDAEQDHFPVGFDGFKGEPAPHGVCAER